MDLLLLKPSLKKNVWFVLQHVRSVVECSLIAVVDSQLRFARPPLCAQPTLLLEDLKESLRCGPRKFGRWYPWVRKDWFP